MLNFGMMAGLGHGGLGDERAEIGQKSMTAAQRQVAAHPYPRWMFDPATPWALITAFPLPRLGPVVVVRRMSGGPQGTRPGQCRYAVYEPSPSTPSWSEFYAPGGSLVEGYHAHSSLMHSKDFSRVNALPEGFWGRLGTRSLPPGIERLPGWNKPGHDVRLAAFRAWTEAQDRMAVKYARMAFGIGTPLKVHDGEVTATCVGAPAGVEHRIVGAM